MKVNKEREHLLVLPEDEATRSLAVGFSDRAFLAGRRMQILNPAGGWGYVRQQFVEQYIPYLRRYPLAHMVLLIDFDDDPNRLCNDFQPSIPMDIADRVYVLGAYTEAETLRRQLGQKLGQIGQGAARECESGLSNMWACSQLQHNQPELQRLHQSVRPFLF